MICYVMYKTNCLVSFDYHYYYDYYACMYYLHMYESMSKVVDISIFFLFLFSFFSFLSSFLEGFFFEKNIYTYFLLSFSFSFSGGFGTFGEEYVGLNFF